MSEIEMYIKLLLMIAAVFLSPYWLSNDLSPV